MPKAKFASITVERDNYDRWFSYYQKNRPMYFRRGISSFASFITAIINGFIPTPFGEKKNE